MKRVAIYTRVSSDPRQRWRSVQEQETECRAFADKQGWQVVEVFCDNSRSASRYAKKPRPAFTALQQFIAEGNCDVLLTWEGSRNQRDLATFVQLRDLLERHKVLWSYDGDVLDMSKARDRKRAAEDAADAEYEVDRTRERILRSKRAGAAAGRPHGRRLYGYKRLYDKDTGNLLGQVEEPDEAAVVRRIFDEYLTGVGVRTIARRLNADGIRTSTKQNGWTDAQVHDVLTRPSYAALRVHQGEVVGPADWPAIIPPERFQRVQARLEESRTSKARHARAVNLLSGIARCGKCGARMGRGHDGSKARRKVYQCRAAYCVARDLVKVDQYVTRLLLERLASADVDALLDTPSETYLRARAEVETLRGQLDDAVREFTSGRLTAGTLAKVEADLLPRIDAAEKTARKAWLPIDLDLPEAEQIPAWWDALTAERKRAAARALIDRVLVLPTGKTGRRAFDETKVLVDWRF